MICKNCGAVAEPGDVYCSECGAVLENNNTVQSSMSRNGDISKTMMIFLILVVCMIGVSIILFFNKKENDNGVITMDAAISQTERETFQNNSKKKASSFSDQIRNANVVSGYSSNATVEDFDVVKFGKYNKKSSSKEDIEWIVLEKNTSPDGRNYALLLSKYVLDCVQYNNVYDYTFWESSSVRQWVNNNFYNSAFNNIEKDSIIEMLRDNPRNVVYPAVEGGGNTYDKVFLLSFAECNAYFGSEIYSKNLKLATKATDYAISNGAFKQISDGIENGNTMFWLRSPGNTKMNACDVSPTGYLNYDGNMVNLPQGIRPAIYVWY